MKIDDALMQLYSGHESRKIIGLGYFPLISAQHTEGGMPTNILPVAKKTL